MKVVLLAALILGLSVISVSAQKHKIGMKRAQAIAASHDFPSSERYAK